LIVRSHDEATLFAGICRTAVESGGYLGAWVGIPDETTGRIEPVAMAGTIDAYIRTIDVRVDPDDPRGQGPTARAWREDRPQYIGDFQAMAAHGPWHELLRSHGIQAMMALPLRRGGRVVAVQSLYSTDPVAPGEESRSLLEQMAADVSFALDSLDVDVARQAAEQEVLRLIAELEQRVAERTEKLQAANSELRSFSYSVSHDLRAPLRAVAGFAELLNRRYRDRLDDTGAHFLDNVLAGSLHMGVLIDELLDYSRLGRDSVRAEPVPLEPILAHLRTVFATRIAEAGATLVVSGPLASPQADPLLLGQFLSNLLDNALTYRRADVPPLITLSSLRHGATVTLSVADNGIGIPPEYHERIFEVFTRLHGEDEYPGTGIGLATVRKAARLMGSEVTVASVVGEGSTFSLVLPVAGKGATGEPA
jgi:signal transduction histidine kinase